MQRVLLTGASGFIGFHLVRRLREENCEIRCLVRKTSRTELLKPFDLEYAYGDLGEADALRKAVDGCDTVFHLAGRVRAQNLAGFLEVNRDGTANLARAAVETTGTAGTPVFVHVSSLAVMGPATLDRPKRETDIPRPISDYGRSKLEGEKALSPFADRMPCSIIRPGIVFGEADKMNLEIFKTVKKLGICPIPGWRDRVYSWIHAADLAELLVRVAKSGERLPADHQGESGPPVGRGIYFATHDEGIPLSEIGREIGRSLGRKRTAALRCPPVAVLAVSTFYETLKRVTNKDQPYDWAKASESMNHWRCSPAKAVEDLAFSPLVPLSERIAQTASWYRDHGWL